MKFVHTNIAAKNWKTLSEFYIDEMGEIKFVYIRDPEGNIIEIQSWQTANGWARHPI